MRLPSIVTAALPAGLLFATAAAAQIAVSANDGKVKLVDGVVHVQKDGRDYVSVIDLSATPPRIIAEIEASTSESGPPTSVAVGPKEDFAIVTAARKADPADPTRLVADDKVTVIDLAREAPGLVGKLKAAAGLSKPVAGKQPSVIATLAAGKGASGVSINKPGTLALVANRDEGTVSVFAIEGKTLKPAGKVDLRAPACGPSHVVFTGDGKSALVTRDNDHKISILSIDGAKVAYTGRDMSAGLRPYGIDITAKGDVAVVANIGAGQGDLDTVSLIDMKASPPRVVNTVTVGQTPEGIKISPDGRYVAVTVMNGTDKPKSSPFFNESGLLQVYARSGMQLSKIGEERIGKWCQGIAWNAKSSVILAQCVAEEEIHVVRLQGVTSKGLARAGTIKTKGGPSGIRTAER